MRIIQKNVLLLIISFLFLIATYQQSLQAKAMTVDDIVNIKKVKNVLIAPDGSKVLYMCDDDLWFTYLDTKKKSKHYLLGKGTRPQWTPNSKAITFLREYKRIEQVHQCKLPKKPYPILSFILKNKIKVITKTKKHIEDFKLSPNGLHIAVLLSDSTKANPNPDSQPRHLWLYTLKSKKLSRMTEGGFYISSFDWSPDSKEIVFSSQLGTGIKNYLKSVGKVLDIKTLSVSDLIYNFKEQDMPCWFPKWFPNGKHIYYRTYDDVKDYWIGGLELAVVDLAKKTKTSFPQTSIKNITAVYGVAPNNEEIYYQVEEGVGYNLYKINIKTGKVLPLTCGIKIYEEFSFSKSFDRIAFIIEDSDTPPELYFSQFPKIDPIHPNQITFLNKHLEDVELGKTKIVSWKNDNTDLEGLLVKPLDYDPAKKYPLILIVHGGPASCFSNRFANGRWNYPTQILASKGFLVFMPNTRGSTSYDQKFKQDIVLNWGIKDSKDAMSGVNHLITSGIVDINNMGIAGWSYGGYLATEILTKTNCFKTASIGAGFSNIISLYGTTDIEYWLTTYFKETPYQNPSLYIKHSPIFRTSNIRIPVLIQHGTKDYRVPFSQAKELYNALKTQNTPVELDSYPNEEHVFKDPESIKASLNKNISWFESQLKNTNQFSPHKNP
jgi:dipeptidyl aminopeptidase/acylaminoacyl peptidase